MKIAIVGASGAVGRMMIRVLEEYQLPVEELVLFASKKSAGQSISVFQKDHIIQELTETSFSDQNFDVALFSAGGAVSERYAPLAAQTGCLVIDNSSTFRQDIDKALVVPEINLKAIRKATSRIIANPNCSTIQCVIPLASLDAQFPLKRVDYVTYQAVSGAGEKGIEDLRRGERGLAPSTFPYPIVYNVIPQIDVPYENGYTKEEMKMVWETQKILDRPHLNISATCVRVPVLNAHSVDIRVEFEETPSLEEVVRTLEQTPSVIMRNDLKNLIYPMPIEANGQDKVIVGRVRPDLYDAHVFHFFCCADNLRKGAAANAVQIAKALFEQSYFQS